MKITGTTSLYAQRRGVEIIIEGNAVMFWDAKEESEWMFAYTMNGDCLTWRGNVYLPQEVKEELPATIFSEKQLREVIDFIYREYVKCK